MRQIALFILFFLIQQTWGQTKNAQIEILTKKSDSLQTLLLTERSDYSTAKNEAKSIQDSLLGQIKQLSEKLDQALKLNKTFGEEILANKTLIAELRAQNKQQSNELLILARETQNDSIILASRQATINEMTAELDRLLKLTETLKSELAQSNSKQPIDLVHCELNALSKTCTYRNYVFTTLQKIPENDWDYKNVREGLYSIIYLKEGNQLNPIDNNDLINSLENELVALVNGKAVQDYQKLVTSGKKPSCFNDRDYEPLSLYDLEFTINETGLVIYYSFFGDNNQGCDEFWSSYTLTLEQAQRYLR